MSRERERKIIGQIKLGSTGSLKVEVIIRLAYGLRGLDIANIY